jgi:hypothetical protein
VADAARTGLKVEADLLDIGLDFLRPALGWPKITAPGTFQ